MMSKSTLHIEIDKSTANIQNQSFWMAFPLITESNPGHWTVV